MKNKLTLNIAKNWSKSSPKLRRNIIAACIIGSTIPLGYSQADLLYTLTTQNVEAQSQLYEQARDQAISTSTNTLSKFIQNNTKEITQSLAVATKQEQVVGESIADTIVRTAQTYMSTLQTIDQNQRIQASALKYGVTGQGYRACNVVAKNKELAQAPSEVHVTAATIVSNTGNQPGSLTQDATHDRNVQIQEHRDKFCTVTEAQSGVCTLSSLPGGDTNASLLFQAVYPDSKEAEARVAVRRNMLGQPDAALPVASAKSPAGKEYLFALNHKASMLAFPAYSLAVIDAQNLKQFADEKGDLKSANEILESTVSRYYGGEEALEWQKSMLAQEPRGLLVEAARIEGLEVWMDQQAYEQGLRMEGLLATLVLSTAEPFKAETNKAEKNALRHQTTVSLPDL